MSSRRAAFVLAALAACRSFDATPPAVDADADAVDAASPAPSESGTDAIPTSCKGHLERDATRSGHDGLYDVDPDGPGGAPPFKAFCDMTLDGGGWTLVGRSAAPTSAEPPMFGWRVTTGDVTDTTLPYSLDVATARLTFTEVLVSDRDRTTAYKFAVPSDFVASYAADTTPTRVVTTVLGDCAASTNAPTMLRHAGATSLTDVFFLRDIPDVGQHRGLTPNGFDLAYDDCERGASLEGRQGMILVR